MKSILTVILVLLGSGITGMIITSTFKKVRAKKIKNGRLELGMSIFEGGEFVDINNGIIIDGDGNDNNNDDNNDDIRDPSFKGWIDTTKRNIRNIIQQHNVLEERVSNMREGNCNDNNNIQRFIGQISQQQHLDIQHLTQRQNHLIIDNSVCSFVDAMFQPEIYQEAATQVNTTIKRRRKKKEKVNVIDTSHDRSFQRDENYVFDILTDHWVLHNNSNFQFGWRTNLNAQNMQLNFIIDTFHGEWVAIGAENGIQESNADWRTNHSSTLATFLLPSQINGGDFRWSDRYDQWIFHVNYNSNTNQDHSERLEWQRDQRQHFGDNYVWNVFDHEWQEHGQNFEAGWRTNHEFVPPDNYVWDDYLKEWVMLSYRNRGFDKNWRNSYSENESVMVELLNQGRFLGKGQIVQYGGEWVWCHHVDPIDDIKLLSDKIADININNNLPANISGVNSVNELLESCDINILKEDGRTID